MRPLPLPVALRGSTVLTLAILATTLASGCVSESTEECYDLQGQVPFTLRTINETGGRFDTDATRWSVTIDCSEPIVGLEALRIVIATPEGVELVVEGDRPLAQRMTWYATVPETVMTSPATTGDPGQGPAYRIRLDQEQGFRDSAVDKGDVFLVVYDDGDGARSYDDDLPYGTYELRIEDRATDEVLGRSQWRFFDPSFS